MIKANKKNVFIKDRNKSDNLEIGYERYRKSKKIKSKSKKVMLYNTDGSFKFLSLFLAIISDDKKTRDKSIRILLLNLEKIIKSEEFSDLFTLFFSCSIFLYFYFYLFFNVSEYTKHILSFL